MKRPEITSDNVAELHQTNFKAPLGHMELVRILADYDGISDQDWITQAIEAKITADSDKVAPALEMKYSKRQKENTDVLAALSKLSLTRDGNSSLSA